MYELAGFAGFALYVGAYAALQLGYLRGRGYAYPLLNAGAASLVLISLVFGSWNTASALIQTSFILISIVGISRTYLLNRTIDFEPSEEEMINSIVPGLEKIEAQQLLRLGRWIDGKDRTVLTQEGLPISDLIWVQSGSVAVHVGGQRVARVGEGSVLGEATCLTGAPATATVLIDGSARYFAIPSNKLRALAEANPVILSRLQDSFSRHLREKLYESNQRMVSAGGGSGDGSGAS